MKREKPKDEPKLYCNSIFKELWAWKRNPEIAVTYFMKSQPWHSCIAKEPHHHHQPPPRWNFKQVHWREKSQSVLVQNQKKYHVWVWLPWLKKEHQQKGNSRGQEDLDSGAVIDTKRDNNI